MDTRFPSRLLRLAFSHTKSRRGSSPAPRRPLRRSWRWLEAVHRSDDATTTVASRRFPQCGIRSCAPAGFAWSGDGQSRDRERLIGRARCRGSCSRDRSMLCSRRYARTGTGRWPKRWCSADLQIRIQQRYPEPHDQTTGCVPRTHQPQTTPRRHPGTPQYPIHQHKHAVDHQGLPAYQADQCTEAEREIRTADVGPKVRRTIMDRRRSDRRDGVVGRS
jgi:hypothetical protein